MAVVETVDEKGEPLAEDELLYKYITLTLKKRALQDEQNKLAKEIESLDRQITKNWNDSGTQSVKRNGYTVYMSRDVSAKARGGDTGEVVDALRKARLGELIGLNHPRIKSWLKERLYNKHTDEWEVNTDKLPPSFNAVVEVSEFFKLGMRKG